LVQFNLFPEQVLFQSVHVFKKIMFLKKSCF
jgi:hypothetical protein